MRRADLYIGDIPVKALKAYKEVSNSGLVAGGEWGEPLPKGKTRWESWEPKPQDREAYVNHMRYVIERHPLTSPINAVHRLFAGNGGAMCIMNLIIMDKPDRVVDEFWERIHKLEIFKRLKINDMISTHLIPPIQRDPDEAPIDQPFIRPRSREMPQDPVNQLSPHDWKELETIGATFFVKDKDDPTGVTAFKLTSIVYIESGKYYKILHEGLVDSIRVEEGELFALLKDGIWF
ncbi:hypothetical protein Clacol_002153 [Clathrus columnatus]|uniref:Uncharacterized protein n=1 Tax=Clathrus columnatus TaxID=1419009 RepID=A0AAV5A4I7_9AGAM|nr:hypothetical protein Clacol_002153 [Clathrus columnatus]